MNIRENNADGKPVLLNQVVTVAGEVTVTTELGITAYLQDSTAGVAIYDSYFAQNVELGDSVSIRGTVAFYNGLTELKNVSIITRAQRTPAIVPQIITCKQLKNDGENGVEKYEGLLVQIKDVSVNTSSWTVSGTGANFKLSDASGSCDVRIDNDTNISNTNAPTGTFDIIGIVAQYDPSSPHTSGYQLMPRSLSDIITAAGPMITTDAVESDIQPTSLTIEWGTDVDAIGLLLIGTSDSYEIDTLETTATATFHQITVENLTPATIYQVKIGARNSEGSNFSHNYVMSTASPVASTGEINVYFTKSIDTTVAIDENNIANGNVDVEQKLVDRIRAARHSIDLCFYSWNLPAITDALIDAMYNRVRIRFIYDAGHNQYQTNRLRDAGIPIIDNAYGDNTGEAINHNKFAIFDAHHDTDPSNDWVWTGSLNMTDYDSSGINAMQNVIEIQDQALARAFTAEFNEMWGAEGEDPNPSLSRFSKRKQDNTPHRFNINGSLVELYFSPSDHQSNEIVRLIATADYSLQFCIFSFTRYDIRSAMWYRYHYIDGFVVQGVFDKDYDVDLSQYPTMIGEGNYGWDPPADVYIDREPGVLHHKYLVIDANYPESDPVVSTGSANWSTSAETKNDENILVIHNHRIVNQYAQEFSARYKAASNSGPNSIVMADVDGIAKSFSLRANYPNPFNNATIIPFEIHNKGNVKISLYDVNGKFIKTIVSASYSPGLYNIAFNGHNLPSGVYFYLFSYNNIKRINKMLILR